MSRLCRHGAEYDPAALRAAMERSGCAVHDMARRCGVSDYEARRWLNPPAGRRMRWESMNRIRIALELTEDQVRGIWRIE